MAVTEYRPEWHCVGCKWRRLEVRHDYDENGDEMFSYCTAGNQRRSLPLLQADCTGYTKDTTSNN